MTHDSMFEEFTPVEEDKGEEDRLGPQDRWTDGNVESGDFQKTSVR